MAFSPLFRRAAKTVLLCWLLMVVMNLAILLYFDVITIPYLSPLVVVVGDSLSPFTPLIDPLFVYTNLKHWLHPAARAYRATQKGRRYAAMVISLCFSNVMLVFCVSTKFSWVMQLIFGFESEEMCVGPCWKLWTELLLIAVVVFAVAMGWDLDGGLYGRFIDRQILKAKQMEAEKAEKEMLAAGGDNEKALGAVSI